MISKGITSAEMVAETPVPDSVYSLGSRIETCGDFGTVKYVGPVEGYPGIWLGIDWDNVERGKHNGTVKGIQYFNTRHPKSGSFVRKEKVNSGQSLIRSIKTRYGYQEDEVSAKMNEQSLLQFQQAINAPFLELVGFDKVVNKQSNFNSLEIINVRLQNVCSIGKPNELKSLCPNICEIDLSKNLLCTWKQIFNVCSQLDHLYWINVSENLLSFPEDFEQYIFPNINVLICGYMRLTWDDIKKISKVFPNITELRAPYNNIKDLSTPYDHNFKMLQYLDLEGNNIRQWSEINKISIITTLEYLIIENIGLENIYFEGTEIPILEFSNLRHLNINGNLIAEWNSIGELNKLRNLENLRLIRNPILQTENVATSKQVVIAKIKSLKVLNGSTINSDERRGAEYDYLKKYALEWIRVQHISEREIFLGQHNRYLDLIETHGMPEKSELIVLPNIIESTLLNVNIQFDGKIVKKKLPQTILIQKLLTIVQKLFRLQDKPLLRYVSNTGNDISVDLEDETKELSYYSIQDGDTIFVTV